MPEQRTEPRKRTFLKGTLYFNNRLNSVECLIRDFSDHGARVQFSAPTSVPDAVELYIPARDQTLHGRVRWRKDEEIGLSFTADPGVYGQAVRSGDLAQRVEALERDVAKLHRMVTEIRSEFKRLRGED